MIFISSGPALIPRTIRDYILLMSRKNNKSIKKRYNNYLKSVERQQDLKKEEKEKAKEERKLEQEA